MNHISSFPQFVWHFKNVGKVEVQQTNRVDRIEMEVTVSSTMNFSPLSFSKFTTFVVS